MSLEDLGFTWRDCADGSVEISFRGRVVKTLKGDRARDFLDEADGSSTHEAQELVARIMGERAPRSR